MSDIYSCSSLFQAGLDVMLSVPRRANDAMYVNMLCGLDVSNKILSFSYRCVDLHIPFKFAVDLLRVIICISNTKILCTEKEKATHLLPLYKYVTGVRYQRRKTARAGYFSLGPVKLLKNYK